MMVRDMRVTRALMSGYLAALIAVPMLAQDAGGFKAEYLNEFDTTSKHLLQLAEAVPADKYGWRPGEGVRSLSEVYMHIATANYLLLALTGKKLPAEYYPDIKPTAKGEPDLKAILARTAELEKTTTAKDQVLKILKQSIEAVRDQVSAYTATDLEKPANFFGEKTTVRGICLRLLAHLNEHYGQSVAYARMNGIVPPWSRPKGGDQ
jgi:uncharacterized damage-inducible protein DinB